MFRTNNFSSSGGLYKQLTVFYHAEIILKLYELSRYRLIYTNSSYNFKIIYIETYTDIYIDYIYN
jgi:hypothetical protein